jgi:hypothetical protein
MVDYAGWYSRGFRTPCTSKIYPRTISIVGVIHGHRHPDTWISRAGPEQTAAADSALRCAAGQTHFVLSAAAERHALGAVSHC